MLSDKEFYLLEDDGWDCTNKRDPWQPQGRGFKKNHSHGSVATARTHLIHFFGQSGTWVTNVIAELHMQREEIAAS